MNETPLNVNYVVVTYIYTKQQGISLVSPQSLQLLLPKKMMMNITL